jgi:hypothetical protein
MTYATSEGDVELVSTLAARGLNLNAGDYDDWTTMRKCCCSPCVCVCLLCVIALCVSLSALD